MPRSAAGTRSARSSCSDCTARSSRLAYGVATSSTDTRRSGRHLDLRAGPPRPGRTAGRRRRRGPARSARRGPGRPVRPGPGRPPCDWCRCSGTRRSAGRTPAWPGWCGAGPPCRGTSASCRAPGRPGRAAARTETTRVATRAHAARAAAPPARTGAGAGCPCRPVRGAVSRQSSGTRGRSTQRPSLASSAGSTVSEPSHRDGDHQDRADGQGGEDHVVGEEQAGHRDDHREAGDHHGVPGGLGGDLHRVQRRTGPWPVPRAPAGRRTASSRRRPPCRSAGSRWPWCPWPGTRWEARVDSPIAAATEESASSTGTPAAISAPNATIRMARVTGRLSSSARLKSLPRVSSRALLIDGPPTCSTRSCGWAAWTPAVASRSGCTRSAAVSRVAGHGDRHQQRGTVGRRHRGPTDATPVTCRSRSVASVGRRLRGGLVQRAGTRR